MLCFQGIIRAHSFRLGALQEEDTVFRVGKVVARNSELN